MREAPLKTTAYNQGILTTSTTAKEKLGTLRILEDGRKFRYAKAGAAIAAGQAVSCALVAAQHLGAIVASINSSGTQVALTVTAGLALANDALAGAMLHVTSGTGAGRSYRAESSTAITAAGTSITFALVDRLAIYDGTTRISVVPSPWSGVLVGAANAAAAGVAPVAVASGSYFWSQVSGPASALIVGTPAVGSPVILGAAGAVAVITAATSLAIGYAFGSVGIAGEYKPVMLTLE
jgi:hypothetical protein